MVERRAALAALLAAGLAVLGPGQGRTQESEWLQGEMVELQALDKITARIATIEGRVGVPLRYGSLRIIPHACTYRPPTLAPENAAFLEIRTVDHTGQVSEEALFSGWMFASSPAVNALEHPVYDISVLACRKR